MKARQLIFGTLFVVAFSCGTRQVNDRTKNSTSQKIASDLKKTDPATDVPDEVDRLPDSGSIPIEQNEDSPRDEDSDSPVVDNPSSTPQPSPSPSPIQLCVGQRLTSEGSVNISPNRAGYSGRSVMQPDGKMIAAFWTKDSVNLSELARLRVVRRTCDGSSDPGFRATFDDTIDLRGPANFFEPPFVHLLSNQKIQVSTVAIIMGADGRAAGVELRSIRLLPDGSIDNAFASSGMLKFSDFGSPTRAVRNNNRTSVTVLSDDSIVFSQAGVYDGPDRAGSFLAKFKSDGNLDTNFGTAGFIERTGSTASDNDELIESIIPMANGSFIAIASQLSSSNSSNFQINPSRFRTRLIKFESTGILSANFGVVGKADIENCLYRDSTKEGFAIVPDGIVIACQRHVLANGAVNFSFGESSLAKIGFDGRPVTSFGTGGRSHFRTRSLSIATGNNIAQQETATAVLFAPASKRLYVATVETTDGGTVFPTLDYRMTRIGENGLPDPTFGNNGVVLLTRRTLAEKAYSVSIFPDERVSILISPTGMNDGSGNPLPNRGNGVRHWRILPNGQLDR